jgi:cupin fold WbuC family metalloprotein
MNDPSVHSLQSIGPHTLQSLAPFSTITGDAIKAIISDAKNSARLRSRICCHASHDQSPQEMIICLVKGTYIRPHRHHGRCESGLALEGQADVVIFNQGGEITNAWPMGPMNLGFKFFYRINEPVFHTLIVRSEYFLFHEVSTGPHAHESTEFANWAPDDLSGAGESYLEHISNQLLLMPVAIYNNAAGESL